MLCYDMLCYVVLCYVMLCYVCVMLDTRQADNDISNVTNKEFHLKKSQTQFEIF